MNAFSNRITRWYQIHARKLPWREQHDPYWIWLSEIILQQTRVEQGLPYYHKFTSHYPTVTDLALAPEQEVLNLWQGLGYYSRARNLHASAQYIHHQLKGKFPSTYAEIIQLKGVGDYTASAIASFAFKEPHAVVDGNVSRILSRFFGISTPINQPKGIKEFKTLAQSLLDKNQPDIHNQAIMEMGSLVCKPKAPNCKQCVLQEDCVAYANELIHQLPVKIKTTKVKPWYLHYGVVISEHHVCLTKNKTGNIWKGLFQFPILCQLAELPTHFSIGNQHFTAKDIIETTTLKHELSHRKITAYFHTLKAQTTEIANKNDIFEYHLIDVNSKIPITRLVDKYLTLKEHYHVGQ